MLDYFAPPIHPPHPSYVAPSGDDDACADLSPLHPAMAHELQCTLPADHAGQFHAHLLPDGTQLARWGRVEPVEADRLRVWTPAGAIVVTAGHVARTRAEIEGAAR